MVTFSKLSFKAVFRKLLAPILVFTVLIILSAVLTNITVTKVLPLRAALMAANDKEAQLSQKLSQLSQVSSETKVNVTTTVAALPPSNSSLLALGQIKQIAQSFAVVVESFKVDQASEQEDGLGSAQISFSVIAPDFGLLMTFLKETAKVAPIMTLNEVSMISETGGVSAKVSLVTYWAPFPKTIPELASPLVSLDSTEEATLAKLQGLGSPSISGLSPTEPSERENPFSL